MRPVSWEKDKVTGYDIWGNVTTFHVDSVDERIEPYEWVTLADGIVRNCPVQNPPVSPEVCAYWSTTERGVVCLVVDGSDNKTFLDISPNYYPHLVGGEAILRCLVRECRRLSVTRHFHYGESSPFPPRVTNVDFKLYLKRFAPGMNAGRMSETFFGVEIRDPYDLVYVMKRIDEEMGVFTGILRLCNAASITVEEILTLSDEDLIAGGESVCLPTSLFFRRQGTYKSVRRYSYSSILRESAINVVDERTISIIQLLPTRLALRLVYSSLIPDEVSKAFERDILNLVESSNVIEVSPDFVFISDEYGYEGNITEMEYYDEREVTSESVSVKRGSRVYSEINDFGQYVPSTKCRET